VLYTLSERMLEEGRPTEALALVQEAYEVDRSHGDRWRMSLTACRLGSVLVALGRPADAALSHAAGLAALEEMGGISLYRAEEDERTLARLREALGEERLEAERQRARKLSLEEAVEAALAEPPSIASTV
jgi:hypothetical protein